MIGKTLYNTVLTVFQSIHSPDQALMRLILASSSPYRRQLLDRLGLPFSVERPDLDESPLPHETPEALARRLSEAKALKIARHNPGALVIGSDQADRKRTRLNASH